MSRFFKKQDDSSSSEDSSEEDKQIKEQPEKKEEAKPEPKVQAPKKGGKPQLYGDDSSESDDEQRVVKTTTEKRTETLEKIFKQTKAHTKNNDFGALLTDFEHIQEEMDKCVGSVFATDKFQTLPIWVLKNMLDVDDCINDITPEQKKKMNKNNSQAFTKLRQKFKKYLETNGDEENRFQAQLEEYKKNPQDDEPEKKKKKKDDSVSDDDSDDDDDDDSDDDDDDDDDNSDSEEKPKKTVKQKDEKKKVEKKKDESSGSDDDSSSDDDDSDDEKVKTKKAEKKKNDSSDSSSSDSDSDSSSSDQKEDSDKSDADDMSDQVEGDDLPKQYQFLKLQHKDKQPHERRWKWVKYDKLPEDLKKFIKPPGKQQDDDDKKKHKHTVNIKKDIGEEVEIIIQKDWELDFTVKENVDRILEEYTKAQNSRKNFLPQDQIKTLEVMEKALIGNPDKMIDILMLLIKANLTYSKNMPNGYLVREVWILICQKINQFLDTIESQKKQKNKKVTTNDKEEEEDFDKYDSKMKDQLVSLTLVDMLEKLDKQLFQAFQSLEQSKIEYLYRLKDECALLKLIDKMMNFFEKSDDKDKVARISLTKLEHIYYKNDLLYEKTKTLLKTNPEKKNEIYFMDQPSCQVVQDLVNKVTKNYGKKEKIRALLLQIYHHAIHNRVREAKDLMMRGQFTQIMNKQPKINRIHYNRALIQIGLGLFRLGRFDEANVLLMEVCQTPRLRESLAQSNKHFEDDTNERKLQRPSHLHINLETLECVYMTTSMFLEIPNISANKFTIQKNVISKNFRKLIDQYDSKGIQFLPQSGRDYIVFAARELHKSHWEQSFYNLSQIQVFQRMNEFKEGPLKAALLKKVQETCLKIYIIENQNCLESMKLDQKESFNMTKVETLKLVSYLIHKKIVNAQICADTDSLLFKVHQEAKEGETIIGTLPQNDRKEIEFLQQKHLEQIKVMVTANERFMDLFVNQSYHQFQPTYQYYDRSKR